MLLGGMKVVGVYIWVNDSSFKNSTITLCQTIKGVADAVPFMDTDVDERLLIHISYSPRRLPVLYEDGSSITKMREILRHRLSTHAKELKGAKCLIDGRLVIEDELYAPDGLHEVEFLLPFMQDKSLEAYSQKEVVGILVFHGSVCSFVYLNPKAPVSQAWDDIKFCKELWCANPINIPKLIEGRLCVWPLGNIIGSLHSRLDILYDEADRDSESIVNDHKEASHHLSTGKQIPQLDIQLHRQYPSLSFPRRVFVPWLAGTYIWDYILPSETIEVLKDHCIELMSMEAPEDDSAILELETEALIITSTSKSFWDIASHSSSQSKSESLLSKNSGKAGSLGTEQKVAKSGNFSIFVVVLIISIVVGLVLFVVRP